LSIIKAAQHRVEEVKKLFFILMVILNRVKVNQLELLINKILKTMKTLKTYPNFLYPYLFISFD